MQTAKTLIRLGGCPGWSVSSLGAHSFCCFCHVVAQILPLSQPFTPHFPYRCLSITCIDIWNSYNYFCEWYQCVDKLCEMSTENSLTECIIIGLWFNQWIREGRNCPVYGIFKTQNLKYQSYYNLQQNAFSCSYLSSWQLRNNNTKRNILIIRV